MFLPLTLSGVDEKAPNEAPIRNDLPGLFVLLLVDRSRPALRVQSSLAFEPGSALATVPEAAPLNGVVTFNRSVAKKNQPLPCR